MTQRYAHLSSKSLQDAANSAWAIIEKGMRQGDLGGKGGGSPEWVRVGSPPGGVVDRNVSAVYNKSL